MKKIKTINAVGHVLAHDITQIIRGVSAGALFKKGHVVTHADITELLSVGKDHLFVYEPVEGMVHEDDAAKILLTACIGKQSDFTFTPVSEGKIEVIANVHGLLKIDITRLMAVNSLGDLIVATRHNNSVVTTGEKLAGMRIIPLVIDQQKLEAVKDLTSNDSLLEIKPFKIKNVGVITTGNEIYYERIKDTFTAVIESKLNKFNLKIEKHVIVPDDVQLITSTIQAFKEDGMELIILTGGMSVDPDDLTPAAIKGSGANVLTYGTPVLPGAMLLISYLDEVPVLGLPGCAMYADTTGFDLILPRLLARDVITREEIAALGHGGLCLKCQKCTFPHCSFGKGW